MAGSIKKKKFMKNIRIIPFIGLLFIISVMFSCEIEDLENAEASSSSGSSASHNFGKNCMSCHVGGGSDEGAFTLAGSVYAKNLASPYSNATIELRTDASGGGTLVSAIEVDLKGNFYNTSAISFGSGLYASVTGAGGTKYMSAKVTTGACSSCHGSSTGKIWAE